MKTGCELHGASAIGGAGCDPHARGLLRSQSGQSLVEVALLTPILLAFLIGGIELGRYAYLSILVGNAARAGAAYGAQSLPQSVDTTDIQTAADNDFQNNGRAMHPSPPNGCSSVSCAWEPAGKTPARSAWTPSP